MTDKKSPEKIHHMKKFFILLVFSLLLVAVGGVWWKVSSFNTAFQPDECPFCNEKILDQQVFFENEWALCLFPNKPYTEGHMLIIPRRHVERYEMLLEEEVLHIHQLLKKIHYTSQKVHDSFSYLLLQKNGVEVGQTTPHVHFHYVPRKINESSWVSFLMKFYLSPFKAPVEPKVLQQKALSFREAFLNDWSEVLSEEILSEEDMLKTE